MAVSKTRSNYPKRIFKSTWELRGSTSSSFLSSKMSKKIQINTRENGIAVHVCWSTKDLIGALVVLIERAGEKTTLFHFKFYVTV